MPADDYTLYIATETEAFEVLTLMCEDLGVPVRLEQRPSSSRIYPQPHNECVIPVPDIDAQITREIGVYAEDRFLGQHTLLPDLFRLVGIPNQPARHVEVQFHILSKDYFGASYHAIIRIVSAILRKVEGDCVWVMTGHFVPGLIRKNGQVIIYPVLWEWHEAERQALSVPFTIDNLPSAPDGL